LACGSAGKGKRKGKEVAAQYASLAAENGAVWGQHAVLG
jgi:hypothetical protein